MGYESLSAVVVLVIVVIVMAGWLPARTAKGMRKVAEHRQDKYSSSLHLVGMEDGTRFSDEHTPQAKGIIMQSDPKYTAERVAEVRRLRRAAIRRRRILVLSLLVITVVVLAVSFPLKFSPLFALIPGLLLAVTVALGARAAAQAREWERKVAASRRAAKKKAKKAAANVVVDAASLEQIAAQNAAHAVQQKRNDEPVTDVLEQREIRRALDQARKEQERAFAEREARRIAQRDAAEAEYASVDAAVRGVPNAAVHDDVRNDNAGTVIDTTTAATVGTTAEVTDTTVEATESKSMTVDVQDAAQPEPADETSELTHVSPSRALDAFDMASSSPDLISFSLGSPRNGVESPAEAPESREIKSTKQVAKAVPVEQSEPAAVETAEPTDAAAPAAESVDVAADEPAPASETTAPVADAEAFHHAEEHGDIDAPQATSDSLGHGLEAILARRSA